MLLTTKCSADSVDSCCASDIYYYYSALGMETTFVSCHAVGSSPTARIEWKIFLNQFIAICPACWMCAGAIPSGHGDLYGLKL